MIKLLKITPLFYPAFPNLSLICLFSSRKNQIATVAPSLTQLQHARQIVKLPLKDFSVRVHHELVESKRSQQFWTAIADSFINRFQITTNPVTIRSYAKIVYSLSKSKTQTVNLETRMALVLPYSAPQSFTTIVSSLSRLGPLSQQFCYVVEILYNKRKPEFNPRERITLAFTLSKNGRNIDTEIIELQDNANCVQMITMLRAYDISNNVTPALLARAFKRIRSLSKEMNALDLTAFIEIYLKHHFITSQIEKFIDYHYNILKRNITRKSLSEIWTYIPQNLNEGKLNVSFIQNLVQTIKILRQKGELDAALLKEWKENSFEKIQNLEIRTMLQKIT